MIHFGPPKRDSKCIYYHGTRAQMEKIYLEGIKPIGTVPMFKAIDKALKYFGLTIHDATAIPAFRELLYGKRGLVKSSHHVYITQSQDYAEGYARTGPDWLSEMIRIIGHDKYWDDAKAYRASLGSPKVVLIDCDGIEDTIVGGVQVAYIPPSRILSYYHLDGD